MEMALCHRPRNAAATRNAILEAAMSRFSQESYDQVGMRDIARDVGVDPALISRYFGSKEDLFAAVMDQCGNGKDLMEGERASWGERVAGELLDEPTNACKLQGLLILLRSISSPKAMDVVQRSAEEKFHGPFADFVGGEDGVVRARLAAAIIMGMAVSRELNANDSLTPSQCDDLRNYLARTLQSVIDD